MAERPSPERTADATTKVCSACGKTLSLDAFYRAKRGKLGRDGTCKDCRRVRRAPLRREYDRQYAENNAERIAEWHRNWDRQNRGRRTKQPRRAAHWIVERAVKRGQLAPPEGCEKCGAKKRLHAHHDDYAKPLEVRWLCPRCHMHFHRFGEAAAA